MKVLACLTVLWGFVACCQAYSFVIPAKTNLPGLCMYNGLPLKLGDNDMPSSCQNMHCNEDGSIEVQGCGHYDMRDCRVSDPMHLDKPYPECCTLNFVCAAAGGKVVNMEVSPLKKNLYA